MNDSNVKTFSTESNDYLKYRPKYPKELYDYVVHRCAYIARSQIDSAIKIDNVHYTVQNSENTTFPDSTFDAICVAQALHWFPTGKFFGEVKRVLKPSGNFFCWGYSFFTVEKTIDTLIQDKLLFLIDPFWADGNRALHHEYDQIHFPFAHIKKRITPWLNCGIWNNSAATLLPGQRLSCTTRTSHHL